MTLLKISQFIKIFCFAHYGKHRNHTFLYYKTNQILWGTILGNTFYGSKLNGKYINGYLSRLCILLLSAP